MNMNRMYGALGGFVLTAVFSLTTLGVLGQELVIYDASTAENAIASLDRAKWKKTPEGLMVKTEGERSQGKPVFPGVAIKGDWDISGYDAIEVQFLYTDHNRGKLPIRIRLGGPNAGLGGENDALIDQMNFFKDKTTLTIPVSLARFPSVLIRNPPWGGTGVANALTGTRIVSVGVYMNKPLLDWTWGVRKITLKKLSDKARTVETIKPFQFPTPTAYMQGQPAVWNKMTAEQFFPCIDVYGQFKYKEWPGKTHSDADLKTQKDEEAKDLAAHPGPSDWNRYGGWAKGPRYKATGNFRVEKIEGKWWMVDPEGCLFWSHGPVRVTPSSAVTPLDNREFYFEKLPKADSPFALFYKTRDELLWPYYEKRHIQKTYDFSASNAFRKYGPDWRDIYAEMAHKRLRSWGMNTVANSSDYNICMMNKTPYTDRIELKSPPIAGSHDGWWQFRDPFDPEFRANFRRQLAERKDEINNPWCFGFFVDNELSWGQEESLGVWTLQSPASQCAKVEFVKRLKTKYTTIEKLNDVWKSKYASWDGLLESTAAPGPGAQDDCRDFAKAIVEGYYRNIRDEFKKVAPNKLYLGCRFAGSTNPTFLAIGAKYCDVLSFNIYRYTLDEFKLPEGIDMPVLVGEYHFGALDRGLFHWTLIGVKNQTERGEAYYHYVESALKHPNFIGVHWHQYADQPTTGRFDGENFQNGFLDVCDTPYRETIEKAREIGYKLYRVRRESK